MIVALPLCVARIVDLCAVGEARFSATAGVQVTDNNDGTFILAATDGRFLGVCRGKMDPDLHCWVVDGPGETLNDVRQVVVPAKDWKAIFSGKDGDYVTIWSDGDAINLNRWDKTWLKRTIRTAKVEGRFPPWDQVMPKAGPKADVMVDCQKLGDHLKAAAAICCDVESNGMMLGFYPTRGDNTLIGISGHRFDPTELTFDGLLVPLELKVAAEEEEDREETVDGGDPCHDESEDDFIDEGADPDAAALSELDDDVGRFGDEVHLDAPEGGASEEITEVSGTEDQSTEDATPNDAGSEAEPPEPAIVAAAPKVRDYHKPKRRGSRN
jgi:hypothetical protein